MPKRAKSPAERTVDRAVGFSDAERKARCWPGLTLVAGFESHSGGLFSFRLDLLLLLDNRLAVIRHHTAQCLRHDAKIGRDTLG